MATRVATHTAARGEQQAGGKADARAMLLRPASKHRILLCGPNTVLSRGPYTAPQGGPSSTAGVPLRGHSYPRRQRRTDGPVRHSGIPTHPGAGWRLSEPETMVSPMGRPSLTGEAPTRAQHLAACALPPRFSTATPHRRLLPKSRLSTTNEPPAEEADEASNYHNGGHRDACDRATGEVGTTIAAGAIVAAATAAGLDVAGDGTAVTRWLFAAYAVLYTSDCTACLGALLAYASAVEIVS